MGYEEHQQKCEGVPRRARIKAHGLWYHSTLRSRAITKKKKKKKKKISGS